MAGIAVVLLAQQIENLVVSPHVIGDTASLHPALVVLFLIAGGWLAGLPGMFYAIPAALSLRAALRARATLGCESDAFMRHLRQMNTKGLNSRAP